MNAYESYLHDLAQVSELQEVKYEHGDVVIKHKSVKMHLCVNEVPLGCSVSSLMFIEDHTGMVCVVNDSNIMFYTGCGQAMYNHFHDLVAYMLAAKF